MISKEKAKERVKQLVKEFSEFSKEELYKISYYFKFIYSSPPNIP